MAGIVACRRAAVSDRRLRTRREPPVPRWPVCSGASRCACCGEGANKGIPASPLAPRVPGHQRPPRPHARGTRGKGTTGATTLAGLQSAKRQDAGHTRPRTGCQTGPIMLKSTPGRRARVKPPRAPPYLVKLLEVLLGVGPDLDDGAGGEEGGQSIPVPAVGFHELHEHRVFLGRPPTCRRAYNQARCTRPGMDGCSRGWHVAHVRKRGAKQETTTIETVPGGEGGGRGPGTLTHDDGRSCGLHVRSVWTCVRRAQRDTVRNFAECTCKRAHAAPTRVCCGGGNAGTRTPRGNERRPQSHAKTQRAREGRGRRGRETGE